LPIDGYLVARDGIISDGRILGFFVETACIAGSKKTHKGEGGEKEREQFHHRRWYFLRFTPEGASVAFYVP
jgi:hypothetical protein